MLAPLPVTVFNGLANKQNSLCPSMDAERMSCVSWCSIYGLSATSDVCAVAAKAGKGAHILPPVLATVAPKLQSSSATDSNSMSSSQPPSSNTAYNSGRSLKPASHGTHGSSFMTPSTHGTHDTDLTSPDSCKRTLETIEQPVQPLPSFIGTLLSSKPEHLIYCSSDPDSLPGVFHNLWRRFDLQQFLVMPILADSCLQGALVLASGSENLFDQL